MKHVLQAVEGNITKKVVLSGNAIDRWKWQVCVIKENISLYIVVPSQAVSSLERKGNFMSDIRKKVLKVLSVMIVMVMALAVVSPEIAWAKSKKEKNVVILYFSATGTTKGAAKRIKKATKGNMIAIKASEPYTETDLDYGDDNSRVTKEHKSADSPAQSSIRPEISNLKTIKEAVKKADVVYIGYPIWWGEAPHIVYTLVEEVSLRGKTVVPFSTSISSGLGSSGKHLKTKAKISTKTKWLKGRNFYDVPSQKTVNKWVKELKY